MREITILILPWFDAVKYRWLLGICGSRIEDYIKCVRVDANIESLREMHKNRKMCDRKIGL